MTMSHDIFQPIPPRGIGAQDAENCRIETIADELRRRCKLYEAQRRNSQPHVFRIRITGDKSGYEWHLAWVSHFYHNMSLFGHNTINSSWFGQIATCFLIFPSRNLQGSHKLCNFALQLLDKMKLINNAIIINYKEYIKGAK